MRRGKTILIALVIIAASLAMTLNTSPAAAYAYSNHFNWTSADNLWTDTSLETLQIVEGYKVVYGTAPHQSPMEMYAWAAVGVPWLSSSSFQQDSEVTFGHVFTVSEATTSIKLQVNFDKLNYHLYCQYPLADVAFLYISAFLKQVYDTGGVSGLLWEPKLYSDTYVLGINNEMKVDSGPGTWIQEANLRLYPGKYELFIGLQIEVSTAFGFSIATVDGDYLIPGTSEESAYLKISSVDLSVNSCIDCSIAPDYEHVTQSGTATASIWLKSQYASTTEFDVRVHTDLPGTSNPQFYYTAYQNAYGKFTTTTWDNGGWALWLIFPGGYVFFTYKISYSGATFGATYHIIAELKESDSSRVMSTRTTNVVVDLTPSPPGPIDRCPNLLIWNGSGFVDEGVLSIHNFVNPEIDVVVSHTLTTTPAMSDRHTCTLELFENPQGYDASHSWIDQVKLYAVDTNGIWHRCTLVSAIHSRDGNVLQLLQLSDDKWAETYLGDKIVLEFKLPRLDNIAQFVFMIEGHNRK